MAGIFISYRRADSDGWAGRLRDALRVRFGDRVFQDVDNIADGEIFSEVIDRALQECDVALVIIGPNWASAHDERGRRLDQDDDWVRTETAMVLNRKIRVIPVLVGGASLPRAEDLPEDLRSLTKRQARAIRSNSWDSDVALLANHLKHIVGRHRKRQVWFYAVAPLVVVAGIGLFAGSRFFGERTLSPAPAEPTPGPPAVALIQQKEVAPAASKSVLAPPTATSDTPTEKQSEAAQPVKEKPPPALPKAAPSPAPATSQKNPAVASVKPPVGRASSAETEQAKIARVEPAPTTRPRTAAPGQESPRPAPAHAQPEGTPDAAPTSPPVAAKPAAKIVAHAAPLNLPNRPASARELRIGDSWTYRLREARFSRDLATITHEIAGGDRGGIRETLSVGRRAPAGDADAESSGGSARAITHRRLPLEPRIFEQQLGQNAALFEFAPFMSSFSELQPGVRWSKIAGATSADSINDWRFSGKVIGRERVRVPAGTFDAIKTELEGELDVSFPSTRDAYNETSASYQAYSVWFVPEIGRAVKYDRRTYNRVRRLLDHEQYELVSYQLK